MKTKKSYKVYICPKCGQEVIHDKPYAVSYSFELSAGLLGWFLLLASLVYVWIEVLA